jgi:hypothetical protein
MTGEMAWVAQDGKDSNGDIWAYHAILAKAVGGELRPFDVYQGPYVVVGPDMTVGRSPYSHPVQNMGVVRLWLGYNEEMGDYIYREDIDESIAFYDEKSLVAAAKEIMTWKKR